MPTGPDVSRHQGTVDWPAVRRAGHAFAIIKATDGVTYRYINWFRENLPKVKAVGLVPGAYHFLLDHYSGDAQARAYVAEVSRMGGFGGLIAVLDVEKEADGTYPKLAHVQAFAAEFRRLVPGKPLVVYTGGWFWRGYLGNPHGADLGPLWHSEYETTQAEIDDGPESDRYGGWDGCTLWQWTSSGTCPGIPGRCDLNLLNRGTLSALVGSRLPTPTQPSLIQEDPDMIRVIGVQNDSRRPFMALHEGYVVKFTDDPVLVDTKTVVNGKVREVQAPKAEYDQGVWGLQHTPVHYVHPGVYDENAELAKRVPAGWG